MPAMDLAFLADTTIRSSSVTYLVLLALVACVVVTGLRTPRGGPFFTLKNSLLFSTVFSIAVFIIFQALLLQDPLSDALAIAHSFSFSISHVLYLWYQWTRSQDVFKMTSSKAILTGFQAILILNTVATLVPPVIEILPLDIKKTNQFAYATRSVSFILTFLVDLYFSLNFLLYIFRRTVETIHLKGIEKSRELVPLFVTVTRYGLGASFLFFCGLILYLAVGAVYLEGQNLTLYVGLLLTGDTLFVTLGIVLAVQKMKLIELRRERG
ncbi:hypothetical protein BDR26DRAFT_855917 [Obelidium mucronatum]|nr:hypothetical protein BDR26DRAFT_855917 [Obelidium mucronatum]